MSSAESGTPHRVQLVLRKPWIGWYPKPTVVFGGRGYPAQWGSGTWQVPDDDSATIGVFLFNRLWKFGAARIVITGQSSAQLIYSAPVLPFLPGKLRAAD